MTEQRPTWLEEPCPSWCARAHHEDDHPDDRFHQSDGQLVAALAGSGGAPVDERVAPTTIVVRMGRYAGAARSWIDLAAADPGLPHLVMSVETARAVADAAIRLADESAAAEASEERGR